MIAFNSKRGRKGTTDCINRVKLMESSDIRQVFIEEDKVIAVGSHEVSVYDQKEVFTYELPVFKSLIETGLNDTADMDLMSQSISVVDMQS